MLNRNVGSITGLLGVAAVVAAVAVTGLTCHKAPSGWEKTDENTIRLNLAVVDSAGAAYNVQLSAGRRDLAVQDAQAILLGHPGTDTVLVAPDSTVWVYFRNSMATGLGELTWDSDTVDLEDRVAERERVGATSGTPGGNVFRAGTFVLPFSEELPGTKREADSVRSRLEFLPNWDHSRTCFDSAVTVENVIDLLWRASPVLFWAGHGVLQPMRQDGSKEPGLLTGKSYTANEMAKVAAGDYWGILRSTPSDPPMASTFLHSKTGKYYVLLLPKFIRFYGNFGAWDEPGNGNYTKTLVFLGCCFSGYGGDDGTDRKMIKAFWDKGADLVCGWDWAVSDGFAAAKGAAFFDFLCDTFMPNEAYRALVDVTDPKQINGARATLRVYGDTLVMIEPVLTTWAGLERGEQVSAETSATGASVTGRMMSAAQEYLGRLTVSFPGPAAGNYDFIADDGASLAWMDQGSGRTYVARKDYVGVQGSIKVDQFAGNYIMGSFGAVAGWWSPGHDPKQDQPDDVREIRDGRIKFTGKMGADSVAPQETTYHHGYIDADETWSPSGNPHIIDSSVYVRNGAWVTIEPGCTVKTADYHGLEVGYFGRGGIKAIGTASAPILFTSNNASPAPGDWGGIAIEDSALPGTRFSYCTIEYAGTTQGFDGAGVSIWHGNTAAEIDNCVIRLGGRYGVSCDSFSGLTSFRNNTVTQNLSYAVRIGPAYAAALDNSNTLTGNDSVGVLLAGPLKTSATWPNLGVPYVIKGVQVGDTANDPVLTIEPGTEVWFRKTGSLTAGSTGGTRTGRIVADGSAGRITFTSMATSPTPGDFYGVSVYEGSSTESEFRSCDFSYGGQGGGDHALLTIHKCNPVVTGCDFGYSAGYGMLFATTQYPDTLAIKAVNTFHDNASGTIKWVMPFPWR